MIRIIWRNKVTLYLMKFNYNELDNLFWRTNKALNFRALFVGSGSGGNPVMVEYENPVIVKRTRSEFYTFDCTSHNTRKGHPKTKNRDLFRDLIFWPSPGLQGSFIAFQVVYFCIHLRGG